SLEDHRVYLPCSSAGGRQPQHLFIPSFHSLQDPPGEAAVATFAGENGPVGDFVTDQRLCPPEQHGHQQFFRSDPRRYRPVLPVDPLHHQQVLCQMKAMPCAFGGNTPGLGCAVVVKDASVPPCPFHQRPHRRCEDL